MSEEKINKETETILNCQFFRKKLDLPADSFKKLPPLDLQNIKNHIDNCPECYQFLNKNFLMASKRATKH